MLPTAVPAKPPPSGMTSDLAKSPQDGETFAAVTITFLSLAVIIVSLRLYTQSILLKRTGLDDYVMVLATLLSTTMSGLMLDLLGYGLGKHIWDVPLTLFSPGFLKIEFVAEILYSLATAASKISILLFYLRIFTGKTFTSVTWVVISVAIAYGLGTALANLFGCTPVSKAWDLRMSNGSCIDKPGLYYAHAGLGILIDSATLLLPIPNLIKLHVPLKQKLSVGAMLLAGSSVCIISIVRLNSVHTLLSSEDVTYNTLYANLWCILELDLSIIGGSVPTMKPFLRRHFPRLLGITSNRRCSSSSKKPAARYSLQSPRRCKSLDRLRNMPSDEVFTGSVEPRDSNPDKALTV